MLDLRPDSLNSSFFDRPSSHSHAILLNQAITLFNHARRDGLFEIAKCALLRRTRLLFDLGVIPMNQVRAQRYGGLKSIHLDCICGTLGRNGDFDSHFHPLDDRLRDRWISIAIARSHSIPLEPVELVQVGDCYFVKDGHHRISVAHARGETFIDAEITVWDICGALPWEKQPAASTVPQTA
jgi:hypothetical protein